MPFRCSIVFEGRRPQVFRTDNESLAEVFGATDFIQKLNAYGTLETIRYKSISTATIILQPNRRTNARFTLADPMPRLGSDVVGGNSGRNHPTSRRHTIHIGRMARNVSIRVGWYERVVQYCTTPWLVR